MSATRVSAAVLLAAFCCCAATCAVQDISVTVLPNGLTVQCLFADEGSMQHMCTVVLVKKGVIIRSASFTGEMTFTDLASGSYKILVFDSEQDAEDSRHVQIPAVQRTVEITAFSSTDKPKNGKKDPNSGTPTQAIILTIGIAILCALLFALLICINMVDKKLTLIELDNRREAPASPTDSDGIYDVIVPLPTSSTIATESNIAYATNLIFQRDTTPAIHTDTNVAYSVLPNSSSTMT